MIESLTESPTEAVIEPEQTTRGGRDGFGLILASASPRRRELLAILVAEFDVRPADIDERPVAGEAPAEHVMRLAVGKTRAVAESLPGHWVIGSDTEVVLDGVCLGKPPDERRAGEMLRSLSGRGHAVYSSVALVGPDWQTKTALCVSEVHFDAIPESWIRRYASSGEPLDKAGGYAIQGQAAAWISRLDGSYSGVVGLPLFETAGLLRAAGLLHG